MNVIARLEYELADYDSTDHRFKYYTMRTPPCFIEDIDNNRISKRRGGLKQEEREREMILKIMVV